MRKGSYSEELVKDVDDTVNLVTPVASHINSSVTPWKLRLDGHDVCASVPRCLTRWKLRLDGHDVVCERACPVRTQHVYSSEMTIEMGVV